MQLFGNEFYKEGLLRDYPYLEVSEEYIKRYLLIDTLTID
jgi:hypothetical protein